MGRKIETRNRSNLSVVKVKRNFQITLFHNPCCMEDMSWFFNVLIIVGGLIIALTAFFDEIARKIPFISSLKSLAVKVGTVLFGTILLAGGTIFKELDSNKNAKEERENYVREINKKDSTFKKERRVADSLHQVKISAIVDSSYSKSIQASNEALAKYNLILVDSMKRVAAGGNYSTGQLSVLVDGISSKPPIYLDTLDGLINLKVQFTSSQATSYNIDFKMYCVSPIGKNFVVHYIGISDRKNFFIVPQTHSSLNYILPNSLRFPEDDFFIVIYGTFSRDNSGKIIVPYRETFLFNAKENKIKDREPNFDHAGFENFIKRNKI